MRRLGIAIALATTAIATPAAARDGTMYIGVEGGPMILEDMKFNLSIEPNGPNPDVIVDHRIGFDLDGIAGYDFGMFRLEGELGYKRASADDITITGPVATRERNAEGRSTALSAMLNGLLDFGGEDGVRGYAGLGVGYARVKVRALSDIGDLGVRGTDSGLAWQAIAGFGVPISDNVELGLKYRFFNVRKVKFSDDGAQACLPFSTACASNTPISADGRWRSHSLLASLISASGRGSRSSAAPAASSAASGDADLPGRVGDPGNRSLPGSAASAAPAATGAGTRLSPSFVNKSRPGEDPRAGFSLP